MSRRRGWTRWHRRAWTVLNASTAPVWLLMIGAPRAQVTRRVVDAATPLHVGLSVAYAGLLARAASTSGDRVDVRDGESVARGLSRPEGMLAGWAHYLTFDLVVGQWIWRTAQEEGINARLALLLTWWAGPLGLTLFTWQRRRQTRGAG
jgi:hypothetical protein